MRPSWRRADKRRKPSEATGRRHELRFRQAASHFLITASLTGEANLPLWVRRLLRSDIAVAAAWPSESAVRVPYRLRRDARRLRKVRKNAVYLDRARTSESWRDTIPFAAAAPRVGIPYARSRWLQLRVGPRLDDLLTKRSARAFLVLLLLHPLFTITRVVPRIRITWGSNRRRGANDGELDESPTSPSVQVNAPTETPADDFGVSETLEVLAEAERAYLDRQVVSFAIRHNDAHLFAGPDRDSDGFVRLMLRESYHDFVLPGSDQEHHVVFEPRLLLHESGVAQIDLVLRVESPLDVRQALAMTWGQQPIIVRSQMSRPLLRRTPWESLADYSDGELDAGAPLGMIEHAEPVSMAEVLWVHLSAVLGTIQKAIDHWLIYPVTMLDVAECCSPEAIHHNHRDDLIRLAIRGAVDREIASHVPLPKDLSLANDHSLYAGMGSATFFQWKGAFPSGIGELDTVLVLEYAQLQYMRLAKMEARVSRLALNERKLRGRYREAIRLFSELRQRDLRAGEAREIVRYVLEDMGAAEMRRTVETALDLSTSAYASFSAERASRRAWWITAAATLVAFVVAVPSVKEILDSLPRQRAGESWILAPLRWLHEDAFYGPWLAMAALIAVVAVPWFLTLMWRVRPGRPLSQRRGFKWPTEFTVTADDRGPVRSGDRVTVLEVDLEGRPDPASDQARQGESADP